MLTKRFLNRAPLISRFFCLESKVAEEKQKNLTEYINEIRSTERFIKKIEEIKAKNDFSSKQTLSLEEFETIYLALTEVSRPLFYTMNSMNKNQRRSMRLKDFEAYSEMCKDQTDAKIDTFFSAKDVVLEEIQLSEDVFDDCFEELAQEERLYLNDIWTRSCEEEPDFSKIKDMELDEILTVVNFTRDEISNFKKLHIDLPLKIHLENLKKYEDPDCKDEEIEDQSYKLLDLNFILDFWVIDSRYDEFKLDYLEYNQLVYETMEKMKDDHHHEFWQSVEETATRHQELREELLSSVNAN